MTRITILDEPLREDKPLHRGKSRLWPVSAAALFATAALVASPTLVMAQAGHLDPTFGSGGKVTTPVTGTNSVANALALQPDGKIVVAGGLGGNQDFGLVRYNVNGSLDQGLARTE